MYIKIDEDKYYQIVNILNSLETFGSVLVDNKINQPNQRVAMVILTLVKQGLDTIENLGCTLENDN